MLFTAIAVTTTAITAVLLYWKRWQMRRLQWRLLALRDELRDVAIADARFAHANEFKFLDQTLTRMAENVPALSIWTLIIGTLASTKSSTAREEVIVRNAHDARVQPVLSQLGKVFEDAFVCQHILLVALLRITIVGTIPLSFVLRRIRALGSMSLRHSRGLAIA